MALDFDRKKSKYGNKRVEADGIMFDSIKERNRYLELKMLQNAKDPKDKIVKLDLQVPYSFIVNDLLICKYVADFRYEYGDGRVVVEDVKGVRTDVYKIKKRLMKAHFGIDILET